MNTRKFFLSLLLLVTATFMSRVFAQSAEEAAKYGQLQEILLPKAGKLGKFIKKADPNATALKISGELNEKDWAILFSLPNVAYLDLYDAKNVATKYGVHEIDPKELYLVLPNTLKFLVVPQDIHIVSLPNEPKYSFDVVIAKGCLTFISNVRPIAGYGGDNIHVRDLKLHMTGDDNLENMIKSLKSYYARHNTSSYKRETDCKTLHLIGEKGSREFARHNPQEIIIESTGQRIFNVYTNDEKNIDLRDYDMIMGYAFSCSSYDNSELESVNLGNKITEIPEGCFMNCKKLGAINMPSVTNIGKNAFYGTQVIDKVQYTYKLSADAEKLDLSALEWTGVKKIDLTEHQYAPELIMPERKEEYQYMAKKVEFVIPTNAYKHRYNVGNWKEVHVIEEGAKDTYTLQLDSIGSLKNYINDENAINVRSLTLKGVMDETDFEVIRKCKNLIYLDLTHCFTFQSAQNAKADYEANVFMLQLFSMAFSADRQKKEQQYAHYEISTEEVQAARIRDNWLKGLGMDDVSSITSEDIDAMFGNRKVILRETCWLPQYALTGLYRLEELKLPLMLLQIKEKDLFYDGDEYDKKSLRKVHLSEDLTYLGRKIFEGATNLTEINFPDSLQYIGISCFRKSGLTKVDLSKTKIKYLGDSAPKDATNMLYTDAFADCQLQEFHSPVGIQYTRQWYDGSSLLLYWWSNEAIIYMNILEPFCKAGSFSTYKELHIPRGQKAAWRGYPNLIDDIDL